MLRNRNVIEIELDMHMITYRISKNKKRNRPYPVREPTGNHAPNVLCLFPSSHVISFLQI